MENKTIPLYMEVSLVKETTDRLHFDSTTFNWVKLPMVNNRCLGFCLEWSKSSPSARSLILGLEQDEKSTANAKGVLVSFTAHKYALYLNI